MLARKANFKVMIKAENQMINIVVRAILIEDGKLVVVKWDEPRNDPPGKIGILVGGRVEYGEELSEALIREVKEETGVDVQIEKLVYTYQQIYVSRRSGMEVHELAWFFLVSPINPGDEACPNDSIVPNPDHETIFNSRIPITHKELSFIYPLFLRDHLPKDVEDGFMQTPKTIYKNLRDGREVEWPKAWHKSIEA